MRFSYAEAMCDPAEYVTLAQATETAGYDSFTIPESICYPKESDSVYPYTPDGDRTFLEDKPFIDPFVLATAIGSATTTLRLNTFVVKLPLRHPVLAAKQASSVAIMTDNRFVFGVGLSPWPDDYRILDVPWERRGRRMNEAIEIVRGLTSSDEWFEYHGEIYDVEAIKLSPTPTKPLPILIGGHSDAALRRAARLADGWMHGGGGAGADFEAALERLHEFRTEYGRDKEPFEIHVISMEAFTLDGIRRLEDIGVTDVIVGFRDIYSGAEQSPQEKLDALHMYADNVIAFA